MEKTIRTHKQAVYYLENLIPKSTVKKYPGSHGHKRALELLSRLHNPQNSYKSIHVTGTSGKGSTCHFISSILKEAGYKVGLFTSPHLVNVTERIKINGKPISDAYLTCLLNQVRPIVSEIARTRHGSPTYFEVLSAIAFLAFFQKAVGIAVVEVGMGGRYDSTNVFRKSTAVITNIGLDHTNVLGTTVKQIVKDKMRIVTPNSTVVTGITQPKVLKILAGHCDKNRAKLVCVRSKKKSLNCKEINTYSVVKTTDKGLLFNFTSNQKSYENIFLSALGIYQVTNAAVALSVIEQIRESGLKIRESAILSALSKARIPARFQIVRKRPLIILDGAHNVDKVTALVHSVQTLYPNKTFTVVFAAKRKKDIKGMLETLVPIAKDFVFTEFFKETDMGWNLASPANKIANAYQSLSSKPYLVVSDPHKALKYARDTTKRKNNVLVTGSLYLIGELLKRKSLATGKN